MGQLALDLAEGRRRQAHGKDRREDADPEFLAWARELAEGIARERGWVSVDDLRVAAALAGLAPTHPNTWGAVFRGRGWAMVGHVHSALPSNRGREVKRWRRVESPLVGAER